MTRNLLDKRMKILTAELAEMGSLVEKQIYNSIEAFRNKDMALAKQVMDNDDKVDELNRKIEEQCLKFMAMESPVATDLRKIFTTSKIVPFTATYSLIFFILFPIWEIAENNISTINITVIVSISVYPFFFSFFIFVIIY